MADGVITGSDEESALVNALRSAFPQSQQLYCMLHCKDNVRHHLTSIGVPTTVREQVLQLLFGCSGVAEAGDEAQLDESVGSVCCIIWLTLAGRLEASASDGSRGSPTRPGMPAVRRPASFAVRSWRVSAGGAVHPPCRVADALERHDGRVARACLRPIHVGR